MSVLVKICGLRNAADVVNRGQTTRLMRAT